MRNPFVLRECQVSEPTAACRFKDSLAANFQEPPLFLSSRNLEMIPYSLLCAYRSIRSLYCRCSLTGMPFSPSWACVVDRDWKLFGSAQKNEASSCRRLMWFRVPSFVFAYIAIEFVFSNSGGGIHGGYHGKPAFWTWVSIRSFLS